MIRMIVFVLCALSFGQTPEPGRKLVWSDEFNDSGLPDSARWGYDTGGHGWGNNELQCYTANRKENARVENGHLIIQARKENYNQQQYTSARLVTKHKGDWKYGRIEVKARLPKGKGIWPAIWMLPTDWAYGGWPESGEIDIMEHVGYLPDSVFGTIHTGAFNHVRGTQKGSGIILKNVSDAFHVYAIEWQSDKIDFFIDDNRYFSFQNNKTGPAAWPFDKPFHLIMNIAVGGNWGGKYGVDDTIFPQVMEVDYVRVYEVGSKK